MPRTAAGTAAPRSDRTGVNRPGVWHRTPGEGTGLRCASLVGER
jgi:hypothetical protein